jgi:hypothetical protein
MVTRVISDERLTSYESEQSGMYGVSFFYLASSPACSGGRLSLLCWKRIMEVLGIPYKQPVGGKKTKR